MGCQWEAAAQVGRRLILPGASPYLCRGCHLKFQDGIETDGPLMTAGVLIERRGVVQ